MSDWITSLNHHAARRSAKRGRLKCPVCGSPFSGPVPEMGESLTCAECDWFGSFGDWMSGSRTGPSRGAAGRPPKGTKLRMEKFHDRMLWHLPASKRSNISLVFGWIWTAISAVLLAGLLREVVRTGDWGGPLVLIGLGVYPCIGFLLLYFGYRRRNATHQLSVGPVEVSLIREWRGRQRRKSIVLSELRSVGQVVFYTSNYKPVYGIELRGEKKVLRFGSTLRDDEKGWLVAEVNAFIHPEEHRRSGALAVSFPGLENFSFPVPQSTSIVGLWWFLCVMGLVFFGVALFGMGIGESAERDAPVIARVLDTAFSILNGFGRVFFGLMGLLMSAVGILGVRKTLRMRGLEIRLEGTPDSLWVRDFAKGQAVQERRLKRSAFRELRATSSGQVNGRPHVRVELFVADRVEELASFVEERKAADFILKVETALGGTVQE